MSITILLCKPMDISRPTRLVRLLFFFLPRLSKKLVLPCVRIAVIHAIFSTPYRDAIFAGYQGMAGSGLLSLAAFSRRLAHPPPSPTHCRWFLYTVETVPQVVQSDLVYPNSLTESLQIENDRRGYQEVCSDCEACGLLNHCK